MSIFARPSAKEIAQKATIISYLVFDPRKKICNRFSLCRISFYDFQNKSHFSPIKNSNRISVFATRTKSNAKSKPALRARLHVRACFTASNKKPIARLKYNNFLFIKSKLIIKLAQTPNVSETKLDRQIVVSAHLRPAAAHQLLKTNFLSRAAAKG
jgi:hypothetical protein